MTNLSYEIPGPTPGEASGWGVGQKSSAVTYAEFGSLVEFDATTSPGASAVYTLPSWLRYTSPESNQTVRTGPATWKIGIAADSARSRSLDGVTFGLSVEKAVIQATRQSNDINGNWVVESGVGVALDVAAPDPSGGTEADEVGLGAVTDKGVYDTSETTLGGTWTVQHVLRAQAGSFTVKLANQADVVTETTPELNTDWKLVSWTETIDATKQMHPWVKDNAGGSGGILIWMTQKEEGQYGSSFLLTSGTAQARVAQVLDTPEVERVMPGGYFVLRMVIRPRYSSSQTDVDHDWLYANANNRLFFEQSTQQLTLRIAGVDVASVPLVFVQNTEIAVVVWHTADQRGFTVEGPSTGGGTYQSVAAGAPIKPLPDAVVFLGDTGGAQESADLLFIKVGSMIAVESYEHGWNNSNDSQIMLGSTAGVFNTGPQQQEAEDYEASQGWDPTYLQTLTTKTSASFDLGPSASTAEDYEQQWNEVTGTFTVDTGTDVVTSTAHRVKDGDLVRGSTTGTLPVPLAADTAYYVVSATTNTFQLALTAGGAAIDITTAGSGVHSWFLGHAGVITTIPSGTTGLFDTSNSSETFAAGDGWDAGYQQVIGSSTTGTFRESADTSEDYETVKTRQLFGADPATDFLTATAHGYQNGEKVMMESDDRLPAGLSSELTYFVINKTTNTFQVEMVLGSGTAVAMSDTGAGNHKLIPDRDKYWTKELVI